MARQNWSAINIHVSVCPITTFISHPELDYCNSIYYKPPHYQRSINCHSQQMERLTRRSKASPQKIIQCQQDTYKQHINFPSKVGFITYKNKDKFYLFLLTLCQNIHRLLFHSTSLSLLAPVSIHCHFDVSLVAFR